MKILLLLLIWSSTPYSKIICPKSEGFDLSTTFTKSIKPSIFKLIKVDNNSQVSTILGSGFLINKDDGIAISASHIFNTDNNALYRLVENKKINLFAEFTTSTDKKIRYIVKELQDGRSSKYDITILKISFDEVDNYSLNFIHPLYINFFGTNSERNMFRTIGHNFETGTFLPSNVGNFNGKTKNNNMIIDGITSFNGYSGSALINVFGNAVGVISGDVNCKRAKDKTMFCEKSMGNNSIEVTPINELKELTKNINWQKYPNIVNEFILKFNGNDIETYVSWLIEHKPLLTLKLLEEFKPSILDKFSNINDFMSLMDIYRDTAQCIYSLDTVKINVKTMRVDYLSQSIRKRLINEDNDYYINLARDFQKKYTSNHSVYNLLQANRYYEFASKQPLNNKNKKFKSIFYFDFSSAKYLLSKYNNNTFKVDVSTIEDLAFKSLEFDRENINAWERLSKIYQDKGDFNKSYLAYSQSYALLKSTEDKYIKGNNLAYLNNLDSNSNSNNINIFTDVAIDFDTQSDMQGDLVSLKIEDKTLIPVEVVSTQGSSNVTYDKHNKKFAYNKLQIMTTKTPTKSFIKTIDTKKINKLDKSALHKAAIRKAFKRLF